jgi:hypothetical protein
VANRMPFAAGVPFGASGSPYGSTIQLTLAASSVVYLAIGSNQTLNGVCPGLVYVWLSSTGATYAAFQVNPDGLGTAWSTWAAITTSATLLYLSGTSVERISNPNATAVAVYLTQLKY